MADARSDHFRPIWAALLGAAVAVLPARGKAAPVDAGATVLYSFTGDADGAEPEAEVISDSAGNLYGENTSGGDLTCGHGTGCGVVYKIDPQGRETTLVVFHGPNGAKGTNPLTLIGSTLFGSTEEGGAGRKGVVFSVNTDGRQFTLLHQFSGLDGFAPVDALRPGPDGTLYGVTEAGGPSYAPNNLGLGVIYSVTQSGAFSLRYSFSDTGDGALPSSLIADGAGTLFGTTLGNASKPDVFRFVPATGAFTVLFNGFVGGSVSHISAPKLGSIGADGTLYGATTFGNMPPSGTADGSLFAMPPNGSGYGYATIYNFSDQAALSEPNAGPVVTPSGALVGTALTSLVNGTSGGGGLYSFVHRVFTPLMQFSPSAPASGYQAWGRPLVSAARRMAIGVAAQGGDPACHPQATPPGCGVVYRYQMN